MKIILNKDISNLGEEGEIKVVADGYARNFLIPNKLAVLCNKVNLNMFEQKNVAIEKRKEEKRKNAMGIKDRLESEELKISMPAGDKGRLFGAVTAAVIVEELGKLGLVVEKKKVEIAGNSIKLTGTYTVKVKLYGGESADLKLTVIGSVPEGEGASEKGKSSKADEAARKADSKEKELASEDVPAKEPVGEKMEASGEPDPEEGASEESASSDNVLKEAVSEETVSSGETPPAEDS